MGATVQLPEVLARRLETLAEEEGMSVDRLIQRLVAEHLERRNALSAHGSVLRKEVRFPLIAKEETGIVSPVTGADLDEMFGSDGLNPIPQTQ